MTAEEPIRPATDEEIAEYLVLHRKKGGGYWNCDLDANVTVRQFIARIEADAATIREQAEEITRLRAALINLQAKCLAMGWGPEAPQLRDARAALSPEPGR